MQEQELLPGRRERKKRATRIALKAAALDLVSAHGFNHVTVEDIATAADVSTRTFFNYFSSKEAALVGDDPEVVRAMRHQLLSLPESMTPLEAIVAVMLTRAEAMDEDLDLIGDDRQAWLQRLKAARTQPEVMAAYSKHATLVERELTDALVERLGHDERMRGYAALLTTCALNMMRVSGALWAGEPGRSSLRQVAVSAFALLSQGFDLEAGAGELPRALEHLAHASPACLGAGRVARPAAGEGRTA